MGKKYYYTHNDCLNNRIHDPSPPGQYPYLRGIHQSMYQDHLWTMRQYAGFGDAQASNKRYQYLLSQGITGLSIAFDLPTQMGYDSDDSMSDGEVGKVGVAISSLEDMQILLHNIPLDKVSTSMTINATAAILLAFYIAVADSLNISRQKLRGTTQNDILKEYIARGTYLLPPQASLKLTTDIFEFCKHELPQWNTISISGYHMREAGSTAVQELAFTLANGLTYIEAALKQGLSIDEFAPRLSFFFNVHNDLIEEVAKFRAARSLWAKLIKERYTPKDERSYKLRFHAQTAGSTLISTQINTNVVRVTLQCLAAVLGGAQSIHTNSKDEALGLPTEDAALLALRTQQVIAYESKVTQIADPLGGSFAIEALTYQIEKEASMLIQKIEDKGGVIACIEEGFQAKLIEEEAYRYQMNIEHKKQIVVGVNEFYDTNTSEKPTYLVISEKIEKDQRERLKKFKAKRDNKSVTQHLNTLTQAAKEAKNLMPPILNAVKNKITLGEIASALVLVFGRHQ